MDNPDFDDPMAIVNEMVRRYNEEQTARERTQVGVDPIELRDKLIVIARKELKYANQYPGWVRGRAMHPYSTVTIKFLAAANKYLISRPSGDIGQFDEARALQTLLAQWSKDIDDLNNSNPALRRHAILSIRIQGDSGAPPRLGSGTRTDPAFYEPGDAPQGIDGRDVIQNDIQRRCEWAYLHVRDVERGIVSYEVWANGHSYESTAIPTREAADQAMDRARHDRLVPCQPTDIYTGPTGPYVGPNTRGSGRSGRGWVVASVLVLAVIGAVVLANALRGGSGSANSSQSNTNSSVVDTFQFGQTYTYDSNIGHTVPNAYTNDDVIVTLNSLRFDTTAGVSNLEVSFHNFDASKQADLAFADTSTGLPPQHVYMIDNHGVRYPAVVATPNEVVIGPGEIKTVVVSLTLIQPNVSSLSVYFNTKFNALATQCTLLTPSGGASTCPAS